MPCCHVLTTTACLLLPLLHLAPSLQVVVGEKHSLALSCWSVPHMPDVHGNLLGAAATSTLSAGTGTSARRGSRDSDSDSDSPAGPEPQSPVSSAMYVQAADAVSPVRSRPAPSGLPLGWTASPNHFGHGGTSGGAADTEGLQFNLQAEEAWPHGSSSAGGGQQSSAVDSLQIIAQRVVAKSLVEPRTVLQVGRADTWSM